MMIPPQVSLIPNFIIFRYLRLIGTQWPLILPAFWGGAFGTFLLRQYFLTIPRDLLDAARVDGASLFGIFWRVYLPLSKPAVAALAIFVFKDAKIDIISILAKEATSVLLDPEVSAAQAIACYAIPKDVGLDVALESTGYPGEAKARQAQILPGWSVAKAKRMGASAVKLLVYYHPGSSTAKEIEEFISEVAEDCLEHDLTLMLEPLSYSLDEDHQLTSEEKRRVVVETARRLTALNVDLLKAEFPLDTHEIDQSMINSF